MLTHVLTYISHKINTLTGQRDSAVWRLRLRIADCESQCDPPIYRYDKHLIRRWYLLSQQAEQSVWRPRMYVALSDRSDCGTQRALLSCWYLSMISMMSSLMTQLVSPNGWNHPRRGSAVTAQVPTYLGGVQFLLVHNYFAVSLLCPVSAPPSPATSPITRGALHRWRPIDTRTLFLQPLSPII